MQPKVRFLALVLGIVILTGTAILPFVMPIQNASDGTPLANLSDLTRFFTIWANLLTAIFLIWSAARNKWLSFSALTALTLYLIIVGITYHGVIAAHHHPVGWDAVVNQIHHSLAPIVMIIIWVMTKSRHALSPRHALSWFVIPVIYGAYAIGRGVYYDGYFPYPFLDPQNKDFTVVLIGFTGFQIILSAVLIFINNRFLDK